MEAVWGDQPEQETDMRELSVDLTHVGPHTFRYKHNCFNLLVL